MTKQATTPAKPAPAEPVLDARQRCDRCGAQAYTRYAAPAQGELQFCLHHTRLHHEGLLRGGFARTVDESSRLVASKAQAD